MPDEDPLRKLDDAYFVVEYRVPWRLVVLVALALVALFCIWFYFTGLWHDLQFD